MEGEELIQESKFLRTIKETESKLDLCLIKYYEFLGKHNGKTCGRCGHIQGDEKLGFKRYFCDHVSSGVRRQMKSYNANMWLELAPQVEKIVKHRVGKVNKNG